MLNALSAFFSSQGIDPLLAGFGLGIGACLLVRAFINNEPSASRSDRRAQVRAPGTPAVVHTASALNTGDHELMKAMAPADSAAIMAALKNGHKIEAIKHLRTATGLGLKDAKDLADRLEQNID